MYNYNKIEMLLIYFYQMYKNIGIVDNNFSQTIEIRPKPIIGNREAKEKAFLASRNFLLNWVLTLKLIDDCSL